MDSTSKRLDQFRKEREGSHPFLAYAPIGDPKPEVGEQAVQMKGIVVVPFQEYGRTALWMFETEAGRDAFLLAYPQASKDAPAGFLG